MAIHSFSNQVLSLSCEQERWVTQLVSCQRDWQIHSCCNWGPVTVNHVLQMCWTAAKLCFPLCSSFPSDWKKKKETFLPHKHTVQKMWDRSVFLNHGGRDGFFFFFPNLIWFLNLYSSESDPTRQQSVVKVKWSRHTACELKKGGATWCSETAEEKWCHEATFWNWWID